MNNVSNWVIGTAALIVIAVTLLSACSEGSSTGAGTAAGMTALNNMAAYGEASALRGPSDHDTHQVPH